MSVDINLHDLSRISVYAEVGRDDAFVAVRCECCSASVRMFMEPAAAVELHQKLGEAIEAAGMAPAEERAPA